MARFFASGTSGGLRTALSPRQAARLRAEFAEALAEHYPELLADVDAFI